MSLCSSMGMLLIDVENGGKPTDPSALLLPDDDTPPALWRLHLCATQANSRDQATCWGQRQGFHASFSAASLLNPCWSRRSAIYFSWGKTLSRCLFFGIVSCIWMNPSSSNLHLWNPNPSNLHFWNAGDLKTRKPIRRIASVVDSCICRDEFLLRVPPNCQIVCRVFFCISARRVPATCHVVCVALRVLYSWMLSVVYVCGWAAKKRAFPICIIKRTYFYFRDELTHRRQLF